MQDDRGCTAWTSSAAFLTGLPLVRTGTRHWPPQRWQAPGCHTRKSEENPLAIAIGDSRAELSPPDRISLTPATAFSPRLGPDYLICVSSAGGSESIWKRANGMDTELWSGRGAQIIGAPAISPDGGRIAFSVRQRSETLLYVMQADGTNARVVADSLELQGSNRGSGYRTQSSGSWTSITEYSILALAC